MFGLAEASLPPISARQHISESNINKVFGLRKIVLISLSGHGGKYDVDHSGVWIARATARADIGRCRKARERQIFPARSLLPCRAMTGRKGRAGLWTVLFGPLDVWLSPLSVCIGMARCFGHTPV